MIVLLTGSLVACPPARDYDFADENDPTRQIKGTTRKCWVVQDPSVPPVVVKFDDASATAFEQVRAMPFGAPISMNVEAGRSIKFVSLVPEKTGASR